MGNHIGLCNSTILCCFIKMQCTSNFYCTPPYTYHLLYLNWNSQRGCSHVFRIWCNWENHTWQYATQNNVLFSAVYLEMTPHLYFYMKRLLFIIMHNFWPTVNMLHMSRGWLQSISIIIYTVCTMKISETKNDGRLYIGMRVPKIKLTWCSTSMQVRQGWWYATCATYMQISTCGLHTLLYCCRPPSLPYLHRSTASCLWHSHPYILSTFFTLVYRRVFNCQYKGMWVNS